ncbi:MAG: hypothetical protein L3J05_02165 [Robiginitomaculum sp.]|nr:hypothetical protein [Robiginitomaculum sp.]
MNCIVIFSQRRRKRRGGYLLLLFEFNHVHVVVTPSDEDGLRWTFSDTHRRYSG